MITERYWWNFLFTKIIHFCFVIRLGYSCLEGTFLGLGGFLGSYKSILHISGFWIIIKVKTFFFRGFVPCFKDKVIIKSIQFVAIILKNDFSKQVFLYYFLILCVFYLWISVVFQWFGFTSIYRHKEKVRFIQNYCIDFVTSHLF